MPNLCAVNNNYNAFNLQHQQTADQQKQQHQSYTPFPPNHNCHPPHFFYTFLSRLRQLVAEYSTELAKFSEIGLQQQKFSRNQASLYGKTAFPSTRVGTGTTTPINRGGRGRKRRSRTATVPSHSVPLSTTMPAFPVVDTGHNLEEFNTRTDHQAKWTKQARRDHHSIKMEAGEAVPVTLLSPSNSSRTSAQLQRQIEVVELSPGAQRRKGRGPMSIHQRLGTSMAVAANALNERMPLEQLEQTVSSVLPEGIVDSQDFTSYLRQYLEEFDRQLGQEGQEMPPSPISTQENGLIDETGQHGGVEPTFSDGQEVEETEQIIFKPERLIVIDEDEPDQLVQMEGEFELVDGGRVLLFSPSPVKGQQPNLARLCGREPKHRKRATGKEQPLSSPPNQSTMLLSPKLLSQRVLVRSAPRGARFAAMKGQNWPRTSADKGERSGQEEKDRRLGRDRAEGSRNLQGRSSHSHRLSSSTSSSLDVEVGGEEGREEEEEDIGHEDELGGPLSPELISRVLNFIHQQ